MTEYEKMCNGLLYDFGSPEIEALLADCKEKLKRLNAMSRRDEGFDELMHELIPDMDATAVVSTPFYCDIGRHIKIGAHSFVNKNCTFLDTGGITIGSHTKIGPNCGFYTPQHPIDYIERRRTVETGEPIVIGDDCWIGGGVTICPGVRIGDRVIIGAGSVVVHDIPSDTMAAGNPAVVKRHLK